MVGQEDSYLLFEGYGLNHLIKVQHLSYSLAAMGLWYMVKIMSRVDVISYEYNSKQLWNDNVFLDISRHQEFLS